MRQIGAEISITTDEGDTVTLSLHSEVDASYAVYRRPASRERGSLGAASISISKSSDIEISVDGNLNEQERADVQKLVNQLSQVIGGFLAGSFDAGVVQPFDDVASNSPALQEISARLSDPLGGAQDVDTGLTRSSP